MKNEWKFVKGKDALYEKVLGREHFWHYHPEVTKHGDCYLVKVRITEGDGHDFHVHPEMNEILYVLRGKAEQWVEREGQLLEPGDSVYIGANVAHGTFNAGPGDLEFLAILSPLDGWEAGTVDVSGEEPYSGYRSSKT